MPSRRCVVISSHSETKEAKETYMRASVQAHAHLKPADFERLDLAYSYSYFLADVQGDFRKGIEVAEKVCTSPRFPY